MNARSLLNSMKMILGAQGCRQSAVSLIAFALIGVSATSASAQALSERGYVEARGQFFFQEAPNDPEQTVGDVLLRQDVFLKAAEWLRFGAGLDLRANSHDQVEDEWRLDFADRSILRPHAAVRRLTATITAGHLTLDVGKQFIRWGRADILNPTDRLAPRDYLNVIDTEFLPVLGARAVIQWRSENFEVVFVPRLTPSRLPLLDQRWTVLPPEAAGITLVDLGNEFPEKTQQGVRWNHVGGRVEGSLSFFDGLQNLPNIRVDAIDEMTAGLTRLYPKVRTYGGDVAIPTSVVTLKGEAAYLQSPDEQNNDYILYVIEFERQVGEWVFDGGYTGEVLVNDRGAFRFAPDSGVAKSIIGRVGYTLGPRRSLAIEGALRQSGDGFYVKGEFSQAFGQHWRATFTGVGLAGEDSDFLGQYHRNSHASIALRFSY
jgi:hypothetical protein